MADIRLYNIKNGKAQVNATVDFKVEKELQKLCEENLETFFAVRLLGSEYSTGVKHRGRIDSLGIDENNCPVIIEYKLDNKENVINQGLFYLDWLMDHQANFEMLCMSKLGKSIEVDWSNPRLLCIAKDFTRYDDYAIGQINRNIELIRYRHFQDNSILFELAGTAQKTESNSKSTSQGKVKYRNMDDAINSAPEALLDLYEDVSTYLLGLGEDVQKKELKYYHAYSKVKNFVCAEIRSKKKEIILFLRLDFDQIDTPTANMRDVSNIGHYGTGNTEVVIGSYQEFEEAKKWVEKAYEEG